MLDVKLKDTTLLVVIISLLIILVWIIVPHNSFGNEKNNLLEIQKQNRMEFQNIIELNWKTYKVYFEEIK